MTDKYANSSRLITAGALAIAWGATWAACLQYTQWGRWLAIRRTWLTVVVGVGVDVLILLVAIPLRFVALVALIVSLSSVGIIGRSLYNELTDETS
jgi:L-cystine uptake protein TcyP (sodium:dicarboxylate symporter family)